jgi:hypothetical protein
MAQDDLVNDWRAMKSNLQQHLEAIDGRGSPHEHGPFAKETIRRWIVELDDLIVKYSFPI